MSINGRTGKSLYILLYDVKSFGLVGRIIPMIIWSTIQSRGIDPLVRAKCLRYCINAASDVNTCYNGKPPGHRT